MPVVLRYSLAMTVADCVSLTIQLREGQHGLVGVLVIIASIVLVGVVLGALAERDTNPRVNAFQSGLSVTLTYLVLDSLARTTIGVFLFGLPWVWRGLGRLLVNAFVILVVGTLASTLAVAILAREPWGGRTAAERTAAEYRRWFGLVFPTILVIALNDLLRALESERMHAPLAALVIVAGVVTALVWYQRRQGGTYRQYCRAKGFDYAASLAEVDDKDVPEDFPAVLDALVSVQRVRLDDSGGSSLAWSTITGQWGGHPFIAFHYAEPPDRAVMVWEVSGRTFPRFALTPEGFLDRLAETVGGQDIDFAEDSAFSRTYRLRGAPESAVRALFTPALRQFFAAHPGQQVAGAGRCLAWWVQGGLPKPAAFDAFLERGDAVRRAFVT